MPNRFNGYDYDAHNVILESHPETRTAKLRQSDTAGRDGAYSGGGLVAGGRLLVAGVLQEPRGGSPSIRSLWREFVAAHNPGTPSPLTLEYFGDRFAYAEVESVQEVQGSPGFVSARGFEVSFSLADPFWYSETEKSQSVLIGSNTNFDYDGTVYGVPTIDLFFAHPGTATITHSDGDQFLLVGHIVGTYSINSRQGFVTRAGGYHHHWDGVFPRIDASNPQIFLFVQHGTVSTAIARWRDRD